MKKTSRTASKRTLKTVSQVVGGTTGQERILIVIFSVLIFCLNIRHIAILNGPTAFNDELGYLGNAAALAGKDWHEVMQSCNWYSYGWSMVITPLFVLCSNMRIIYRCVNVINALLLVAVFLMQRWLLRGMFPDKDRRLVTTTAACVCLYPAYLMYSSGASSEVWLLFVFTLVTTLLYRVIQAPKMYQVFLFGFLLYYCYVCHNRLLGVLLAGILVFALLALTRAVDRKSVLLFAASLILAFFLFSALKGYVVSQNWREGLPAGNNFSGGFSKLLDLTSIDVLKNFLCVLASQALYSCLASYGALPFGVFLCLCGIVRSVKRHAFKEAGLELWLVLSFLSTLAISAIYFGASADISSLRVDHVFYGRYFAPVSPLLIAYGLLRLSEWGRTTANRLYETFYPCVILLCALGGMIATRQLTNPVCNLPNVSSLGIYSVRFDACYLSFVAALFALTGTRILVSCFRGKKVFPYIGLAGFSAVCVISAFAIKGCITSGQESRAKSLPLVDSIASFDTGDTPVYIVDSANIKAYYQCMLVDIPLRYTPRGTLATIPEDRFYAIISKADYYEQGFDVNAEILANSRDALFLSVDKTADHRQDELQIPLDWMNLKEISQRTEEGIHVGAGEGQLAFFGPYATIDAGDYTLRVDLSAQSAETPENYGALQTYSGSHGGVLDEIVLTEELSDGKREQVTFPFTLTEDLTDLEIYLRTSPGVTYDVYQISLSRSPAHDVAEAGNG